MDYYVQLWVQHKPEKYALTVRCHESTLYSRSTLVTLQQLVMENFMKFSWRKNFIEIFTLKFFKNFTV